VVVTVAADGTKLPPFSIFKGQPGKCLEQQFKKTVAGCCQVNGWVKESVIDKWIKRIIELYMRGSEDAFLLVDHYKVHMTGSFVNACNNLGVDVDYIHAGHTFVLQPIDVDFNAPLKRHIHDFYHKWCIEKYRGITNAMNLPVPTKEDLINWVTNSYD
jgi:DDE superfamily endonuclease